MGERSNILLVNDGIYLYSHWDTADEVIKIVRAALIRGEGRWDDRQYLNRIIFSELIQHDVLGITGYGLSTDLHDGDVCISIDINKQEINGESFIKFIGA